MSGSSAILLGVVLGLMMAFDMGGPLNKVAYSFAAVGVGGAALASDAPELRIMAAVMLAGMVPPIALALATVVRPGLFNAAERENGKAGWLLGAVVHHRGRHPVRRGRPAARHPGASWRAAPSPAACRWPWTSRCAPRTAGSSSCSPWTDVLGYFIALAAGVIVGAQSSSSLLKSFGPSRRRRRHRLTRPPRPHHPTPTQGEHMPSKSVVVGSAVGLHARPAAIIAEKAGELGSDVTINGVDASSSLMIMTLGAGNGDTVEVAGDDQAAVDAIAALVEQDLDA